ncbi:DNRLRE domain-containing protein [Paenibacillus sp. N3.4]|uniref:CBM96 family carbohydrate-binding protein n=1 Tax=Paenibacillus sp. N3.4 TaxID=2603222 RepID=UPI00164EDAD3|nr:DNRLRE domain-containing protein [Paenibacillus sp. N3.4]
MASQQIADQTASIALIDTSLANCFVSLQSSEASNKPYLTITYMPASPQDTEPPVWPAAAQLTAVLTNSTSVRLDWSHAQDISGISGYRIYANDVLLGGVGGTINSYDAVSLIPGETYEFRVEAADSALNWSQNGPKTRVTIPITEQQLIPTDDTYVNGGSKADINFANDVSLLVKNNTADLTRMALLKFDLGSAIEDIGSADLYVYALTSDGGGTTVTNQLYSTDSEQWSEALATWNNKPGEQDYLQSFTADRTAKWFALDVTAYVKGQSAAGKAASFLIRQEVQYGLNVLINSKENAVNKPYLRITKSRANPDAPGWGDSPHVTVANEGEDEIGVSWTPAIGADTYKIYANGVPVGTASGSTTNYTLTGLAVGKPYTIKLEAGTAGGAWSTDGPFVTAKTLETKLVQTQLGNVYWSNENLNMKVQSGRTSVSWRIIDVWGSQVASGVDTPHNGETLIQFPSSLRGYFTLKASAEEENRNPISLETSFTILTPYDVSQVIDSPFGINTHFTWTNKGWSPSLTELIAKAGIKNVREGSEWGSVEKQKGVYTVPISPAAEYMDDFREKSLDQLWVLAFTNPFYDSNSTPYTDEGREGFANHAKAILDAYNGTDPTAPGYNRLLKQVEVYNEFNIGFGDRGTGPADSKPEYYFPLLKKTYETVKSAHPDTIVSGMSTAGVPLSWLESVMKLGGLKYMDTLTIHPYVYPKDPEMLVKSFKDVNDLVRKYNGGKTMPIWLSEIGWPTHNTLSGVSDKKSADDLVRGYVLSLANGVEKIFWYDLMNDGLNKSNNEDNFGLIRNKADQLGAYTPKPAFTAYAVMIRQLSEARFDSDLSAAGSYYHYLFKKGSEDIRAAWAVQPTPVVIRTQAPVRIVDYMGNETVYTPIQGKVYFTLNGEAVYIHGSIEGIEEDSTFVLAGEASLIHEEGKLKLSISNRDNVPLSGTFEINGQNYPFNAAPGSVQNISIRVPGLDQEGSVSVRGKLTSAAGNPLGMLVASIPFQKPFTVEVKPFLAAEPGADPSVRIIVDNHGVVTPLGLTKIDWSIGQLSGTIPSKTIAPSTTAVESIPLPGFVEGKSYRLDVTVVLAGYDPIHVVSSFDFNRVAYRGGAYEPVSIDLSTGTNRIKPDSYTGPDDLSGSFNLTWDETNFYLEADIVDDHFQYPFVGQEIYKNDSIQFGMAGGIPGTVAYNYEIGLSQTAQGPQIYFYNAPQGIPLGIHDNGDMDLKVNRDEVLKVTKYRLRMPWRELVPIIPAAGNVISFSMLVNDNDTGSREGYIEWGSGIGGSKDPTLYRAIQLMTSGVTADNRRRIGRDRTERLVRLRCPSKSKRYG